MTDAVPALLPMKAHSERVPDKNLRLLGDRPLFQHVLGALRAAEHVSTVFIDTDSDEIAAAAESLAGVTVIERPEALRGDDVPMTDIIRHDLSVVPDAVVLQTHATNPFLSADTIDRAIATFRSQPDKTSLVAVTPLRTRLYWPDGRPINHDPSQLLRTQDLDPVYEENSNLYLFERDLLLQSGRRFDAGAIFFEVDGLSALDIDTEEDFTLAEALWHRRQAP